MDCIGQFCCILILVYVDSCNEVRNMCVIFGDGQSSGIISVVVECGCVGSWIKVCVFMLFFDRIGNVEIVVEGSSVGQLLSCGIGLVMSDGIDEDLIGVVVELRIEVISC